MKDSVNECRHVWKVGSRWSYDGNSGSCILEVFRRHRIVFVGHEHDSFNRIKEGDLIVISSGTRVVAFGQAMEDAVPFDDNGIILEARDLAKVDPEDIGYACRISYRDLKPEDYVDYRIGAFHQVHEKAEHYRKLFLSYEFERRQEQFSIKARSCTLLQNAELQNDVLLKAGDAYHIPIFQRAYSWGNAEVRRLIGDLLNAFFGRLGRSPREPMFIGTIQVAAPKPKEEDGTGRSYDVIDGQQRLTTLALILRALQIRMQQPTLTSIAWLSTAVGTQQDYLAAALTASAPTSIQDNNNLYLINLNLILGLLNEDEDLEPKDDASFLQYLTSQVYFVVIETRAGLSKTLQIFNSINTAGMDLSGGDVFKIRYYEYLRERENAGEAIFENISNLYTSIDKANREDDSKIWLENVLNCAKWVVCNHLDLSYQAREYAGTTFFERLFDTVLKVESWEAFSYEKCEKLRLPLSLFEDLILACIEWRRMFAASSHEARSMKAIMEWSRYENYSYALIVLFIHRFKPSQDQLNAFVIQCGKLLLIYSIRFMKKTYEGRNVMHDVLNSITQGAADIPMLMNKIQATCALNSNMIHRCLVHDYFAFNPKGKNLICRLAALLEEWNAPDRSADELCKLMFWEQEIDIEHIEAANHKDGTLRADIEEEWGQDLHGLGNLTVLERKINRSISNEPYSSHKRERYLTSKFRSVKAFAQSHEIWSLELARARKIDLADRLRNYLCNPSL